MKFYSFFNRFLMYFEKHKKDRKFTRKKGKIYHFTVYFQCPAAGSFFTVYFLKYCKIKCKITKIDRKVTRKLRKPCHFTGENGLFLVAQLAENFFFFYRIFLQYKYVFQTVHICIGYIKVSWTFMIFVCCNITVFGKQILTAYGNYINILHLVIYKEFRES